MGGRGRGNGTRESARERQGERVSEQEQEGDRTSERGGERERGQGTAEEGRGRKHPKTDSDMPTHTHTLAHTQAYMRAHALSD